MDEETARAIYARIMVLAPLFDDVAAAIDGVRDETVRRRFRRAVGESMAELITEIMRPLETRYPGLAAEPSRKDGGGPG